MKDKKQKLEDRKVHYVKRSRLHVEKKVFLVKLIFT